MSGSTLEIPVDSAVSNGQVLIMRSDTARGNGVPVHVHQREDEIFLLLNGALTVWAGDQRRELSGGGVAVLPKGVPHTEGGRKCRQRTTRPELAPEPYVMHRCAPVEHPHLQGALWLSLVLPR